MEAREKELDQGSGNDGMSEDGQPALQARSARTRRMRGVRGAQGVKLVRRSRLLPSLVSSLRCSMQCFP
eukprot:759364-Hanusia_phi.AAC.3